MSKIIRGEDYPANSLTPEEIQKYNLNKDASSEENGIPGFWLTALVNSKFFYMMSTKDKEILKFLTDIKLEILENKVVSVILIYKGLYCSFRLCQ